MSDILLSKQQSIERCLQRARSAWEKPSNLPLAEDYDKQDIVILNLQRACEQVLDMANHTIRAKKLGWTADSAGSFTLLRQAGIIDAELEKKLIGMVGFRNIVTHQYRDIDYEQVAVVIKNHADDLIAFAGILVAAVLTELP